jgi:MFS family permease
LYSSCVYLGALLGYIFVSFFADNYGRKKTAIWAWSICCLGCLILTLSQTLWMAGIGLFLAGFGSDSVLNITGTIIAEQFGDYHRQRYYTVVQGVFTSGALFVTLIYYLWKSWFITVTYFLLIPSLITLACIIIFIKESPLYLIRASPQNALS